MSKIKIDTTDIRSKYIFIPAEVITNTDWNEECLLIYTYFAVKKGIDNIVIFSVNSIVEWCAYKIDKHKGKINDKIKAAILQLAEWGYFTLNGELDFFSPIVATLNFDKFSVPQGEFALIYLDEIYKLIGEKKKNSKFKDLFSLFKLLCYLRWKIFKRYDKTDENSSNSEDNIKRYPEAYSCLYKDIADNLKIASVTIARLVDILKDLEIITYTELQREQNKGKWFTNYKVFANCYKRIKKDKYVYEIGGAEYYLTEIKNKIRQIKNMKLRETRS